MRKTDLSKDDEIRYVQLRLNELDFKINDLEVDRETLQRILLRLES